MSRRLGPCLVLTLLSMAAASVEAAPIRVTVVGDQNAFHVSTLSSLVPDGIMSQTILPDDFSTQGYYLGWERPLTSETAFGGHAGLTFIFDRLADGPPAAGSPSVTMKATTEGYIEWSNRNGFTWGQQSLKTIETSLANWSTDSDIPRSVIDTFLNPRDPSMTAMGGGYSGGIDLSLSLQPVPEPTTCALWGLVGLGALAIRRRRLRQRECRPGDPLELSPSAR